LFLNNISGFRGVRFHSAVKKWCAEIKVDPRRIYLGVFEDKIDAAIAYDMAALMFNGDFAQTNVLIPQT
jgi:hypothetical protein